MTPRGSFQTCQTVISPSRWERQSWDASVGAKVQKWLEYVSPRCWLG